MNTLLREEPGALLSRAIKRGREDCEEPESQLEKQNQYPASSLLLKAREPTAKALRAGVDESLNVKGVGSVVSWSLELSHLS